MSEKIPKTCVLCSHCDMETGYRGWSEWTPGSPPKLKCGRGYWRHDNADAFGNDLRRALMSAETCSDFSLHPRVYLEVEEVATLRARVAGGGE